ncbi:hypothetical protein SK128_009396 [Halocaridina rubra]|uniref:C2H2-type domain-containing protein n=1 Tax=Halocaridina rubra TaxID=373956 RepID=A0AAN8XJ48_HALRR
MASREWLVSKVRGRTHMDQWTNIEGEGRTRSRQSSTTAVSEAPHNFSYKIHRCPYCQYATTIVTHMKRHILSHTGEKPYSCSHCSYSCITKDDLKKHIRTHTGEKPYLCPHCPYRSSRKYTLKVHLVQHQL